MCLLGEGARKAPHSRFELDRIVATGEIVASRASGWQVLRRLAEPISIGHARCVLGD